MIAVVPHFLPAEIVTALGAGVRKIYDGLDVSDALVPDNLRESFRYWNGLGMDALAAMLDKDPLDLMAIVGDRLHRFVSGEWSPQPAFSYFRRATIGKPSAVQWHIDAEAASTLPLRECINVWVPFDAVGGDTGLPSLELIEGSDRFMRAAKLHVCQHRTDEFCGTVAGQHMTPALNVGDALIFDHFTLHRTQQIAKQVRPRLSAEFRFTPKEAA